MLALLVLISGCGEILSTKEAPLLVDAINEHIKSVGDITPPAKAEVGDLQVYVDRSASMRPYTSTRNGAYANLLRTLDGQLAGQIDFYGFGYPSEEQGQVVSATRALLLEDPSAYVWVNNDYGSLFSNLEPDQSHLIISDGIQSEPEEGARFGGIVSSIGEWLETGGVFTLIAYRSPYEGTYYHEAPTKGAIAYNCSDRPFYGFGFFPSVSAKQEYLAILEANDIAATHQLTIGTSSASVAPRERAHPVEDQRRGERLLRSFTDHRGTHPDVGHVFSGQVVDPKGGAGSPLQFDVSVDSTSLPWRALSDADRERVMDALEPTFQHWHLDTLSVANDNAVLTETDAPRIFNTGSTPHSTWQAHVDASISYAPKQRQRRIASVVQVGLGPTGANQLIPDALTTNRDDYEEACSQTLNIQKTMGAVVREHYVLGEALLVTEWR